MMHYRALNADLLLLLLLLLSCTVPKVQQSVQQNNMQMQNMQNEEHKLMHTDLMLAHFQ